MCLIFHQEARRGFCYILTLSQGLYWVIENNSSGKQD